MLKLKLGNFKNLEPFHFGKVYQVDYQDFSLYLNHGELKERIYSSKEKSYIEFIQEKLDLLVDLELHVQNNAHCLCNLYFICSLKPQNKIDVCIHEDCFIEGNIKKITLNQEMKDEYANRWNKLVEENAPLRIFDENQYQVISVKEDYYDSMIKESLNYEVKQKELLQFFENKNIDSVWISKRMNQMIDKNEIVVIQDDPIFYNRIIIKR